MRIHVKKNFIRAFGYFLRSLRHEELNFAIEGLPLPNFLLNRKHDVPATYKQAFSSPYFLFLLLVALTYFFYHWARSYKDLRKVVNWLEEVRPLLNDVCAKIPRYTGYEWQRELIEVHPVIAKWGGERSGRIYIGIRPLSFLKNPDIALLIHELIHANVPRDNLRKKIYKSVQSFNLSEELATILLTRRIQEEVLRQSVKDFQKLSVPLQSYLSESDVSRIYKSSKNAASFAKLVTYADRCIDGD